MNFFFSYTFLLHLSIEAKARRTMEGEEKEAYNFLCHAMIFFLLWRKKNDFRRCCHFWFSCTYHDGVPSYFLLLCIHFFLRYLMYHRRSLFDGSMSDDDHLGGERSGGSESERSRIFCHIFLAWRHGDHNSSARLLLAPCRFSSSSMAFSSLLLRWKKINIASFEDKQQTYDGRRNSGRGRETRKKSFVVWIIRVWAGRVVNSPLDSTVVGTEPKWRQFVLAVLPRAVGRDAFSKQPLFALLDCFSGKRGDGNCRNVFSLLLCLSFNSLPVAARFRARVRQSHGPKCWFHRKQIL